MSAGTGTQLPPIGQVVGEENKASNHWALPDQILGTTIRFGNPDDQRSYVNVHRLIDFIVLGGIVYLDHPTDSDERRKREGAWESWVENRFHIPPLDHFKNISPLDVKKYYWWFKHHADDARSPYNRWHNSAVQFRDIYWYCVSSRNNKNEEYLKHDKNLPELKNIGRDPKAKSGERTEGERIWGIMTVLHYWWQVKEVNVKACDNGSIGYLAVHSVWHL